MSEKEQTCTVCGMRPFKLPKGIDFSRLLHRLEEEIKKSILQGYTAFQTGMAMGVDIWAAELVLKLKEEYPTIRLICCLPCETQADEWSDSWRERYFNVLGKADTVICLQTHYTNGCMQQRNRKMADGSSRLIAVYDGTSSGGTAQTVRYAKKRGVEVVMINPLDCLKT